MKDPIDLPLGAALQVAVLTFRALTVSYSHSYFFLHAQLLLSKLFFPLFLPLVSGFEPPFITQ